MHPISSWANRAIQPSERRVRGRRAKMSTWTAKRTRTGLSRKNHFICQRPKNGRKKRKMAVPMFSLYNGECRRVLGRWENFASSPIKDGECSVYYIYFPD